MNPTKTSIGLKVLRFLSPENEKSRMSLRESLCQNQANSEDINRTMKLVNGHLSENPLIQEWRLKK